MCVCVLISNIDAHTMVHKETTSMSVAFYVYIVFLKSGLSDSHSHFGSCFCIACAEDAQMAGRVGPTQSRHRNIALARSQQKAPP